jgi:hypothetical protein
MVEIIQEDSQGKRRTHVELTCPHCNSVFLRVKKNVIKKINSGELVCCSEKCRSYIAGKYTTITCSMCGKEKERKISSLSVSKHGVYFCSRVCKDKGQRVENGITKIHPPHYSDGYSDYQERAFREYGKYCKDCGETAEFLLCVHHKDGNRKNGEVENLEVLCYNHHAIRHLVNVEGKLVVNYKMITDSDVLTSLM